MKILVAEDDDNIRQGLIELLEREGYQAVAAADGREALQLFATERPDFVCLDIMMPGVNGYDVCRKLRETHPELPIIFISAKSEEIDKVVGLELGADDFIMKPFGVREVAARIRAVTRRYLASRGPGEKDQLFEMADITVFPAELRARRGETTIELSLRDVCILRLLYNNRGKVVDRDSLFNHCWRLNYVPSSRSLDQHISQLRRRIETAPHDPQIIRTVHGLGYRFE